MTNLIDTLDFPAGSSILNADLNTPQGIQKATEAVSTLRDALTLEVCVPFFVSNVAFKMSYVLHIVRN